MIEPAKNDSDERMLAIIEARRRGDTLAAIGSSFGITRERIRQILKGANGPTRQDARRAQLAARQSKADSVQREIRIALEQYGPATAEDISLLIEVQVNDVAACWPKDLNHLRLHPPRNRTQAWSDRDIISAIQDAALYEFPLTAKAYAELQAIGQINGPSLPRISQRFRFWATACEAAGVEHGAPAREDYQSEWTDHDLLAYVSRYLWDGNYPNSVHGYDQWRRSEHPEAPSFSTIRNRLGTWTIVKTRALEMDGLPNGRS